MGHYSLFVRPGMHRVQTSTNTGLTEGEQGGQIMVSAFKDEKTVVVNVINYTIENTIAGFAVEGLVKNKKLKLVKRYVTSADGK